MNEPLPPPEADTYETNPRIEEMRLYYGDYFRRMDGRQKIHYTDPGEPEECLALFANDGFHLSAQSDFALQTFADWFLDQDMTPLYEGHKRQLQILQHRFARDRWVLKLAEHMWFMRDLLRVYPDARIIMVHRDPMQTIPSMASFMRSGYEVAHARHSISLDEIGRRVISNVRTRIDRGLDGRDRAVADPANRAQFVDLWYRDLVARPVETLKNTYDALGLAWSDVVQQNMAAYISDNPRHKHGSHSYSGDEFGISEGEIRERFGLWD